jgi:hypothetical protein
MKKAVLLVCGCVLSVFVFGQLENVACSSDSSIVIERVYIGSLGNINVGSDLESESGHSLRFGVQAYWTLSPILKIKAYSVYDRAYGEDIVINNFSLRAQKNGFFGEIGRMATPSTELRPLPPTADAQFETWTQSRLPGGSVGIKGGYVFAKDQVITLGLHERNGQAEYGARLQINKFNLAAAYETAGDKLSLGSSYKSKSSYHFLSAVSDKEETIVGSLTIIDFQIAKQELKAYLDAGYSFSSEDFPRLEIGLLKNIEAGLAKGLFGLGWSYEIKAVKAYLFVHI